MEIHINTYRKLKRLTLNELSVKTGISPGQLSQMENKKRNITLKQLCLIGEALGVDPKKLFDC